MPRLNLKVVGNHLHRCNNSSPRYERENHYAIFVRFENFLRFQVQDKHNASYFPKCRGPVNTTPTAKLTKIFENEGITAKKIADYDTPDTERAKASWNGNFSQPM